MVCDAARYSAARLLASGHSLFLVPGGATEALYATPGADILILRKRRGFVRLALRHGASLLPAFSFNENNTYRQVPRERCPRFVSGTVALFQRVFGISVPLLTNLLPLKTRITTVFGSPIDVGPPREPTEKEITDTLERYIARLTALYEKYGPVYNEPRDKKLIVK
jgi:2-acylglycerol O-acyltransferase 2